MTQAAASSAAGGSSKGHAGYVGRQVALRREHLGLSREAVADEAGVAPAYLRYMEEHDASPSTGTLLRLAAALGTSLAELHGSGEPDGSSDGQKNPAPPEAERGPSRPVAKELSPAECRERMGTSGVGRLAVSTEDGPAIVPVAYTVDDDSLVVRIASGPLPRPNERVPFEVDQVDGTAGESWSVLVVGRARRVADPAQARERAGPAEESPWPYSDRDVWLRITPERVTGRVIASA